MEDLVRVRFDLWSSFLAFGIFQGLVLILILLSYKKNTSINFLVGLLLILVLNLFNYLIIRTNLYLEFPHVTHAFTPLMYLIGPVYYGYIRSIVAPPTRLTARRILAHSTPFFLSIVAMMPFYLLTGADKVHAIESQDLNTPQLFPPETVVFISAQIIQSFVYIFQANRLIQGSALDHSKQLRDKCHWLLKFGWLFFIYWALDFVAVCWHAVKGKIHPEVFYLTMLSTTLFINLLVFFAIRNNREFSKVLLNAMSEKYRNSSLTAADVFQFLRKITQYMESERPYLDSELSLTKLSDSIDIPSHQVSQVLNLELGKNFYEFVNEYRFKEVKERLLNPKYKYMTILAIAFDSGFNNKNTFNKVFKKHSGKTPSQFLKAHNSALQPTETHQE